MIRTTYNVSYVGKTLLEAAPAKDVEKRILTIVDADEWWAKAFVRETAKRGTLTREGVTISLNSDIGEIDPLRVATTFSASGENSHVVQIIAPSKHRKGRVTCQVIKGPRTGFVGAADPEILYLHD